MTNKVTRINSGVSNKLSARERAALARGKPGARSGLDDSTTVEVTTAYQHVLLEAAKNSKFVYSLVEHTLHIHQVDSLLWEVSKMLVSDLNLEDLVVYLLSENGEVLEQRAACGPKSGDGRKIVAPIEIPVGEGIVGSVAESGVPEIVRDTRLDERYVLDDTQRLSELTVPIINTDGSVIGAIDSEHSIAGFFTPEHMNVFRLTASIISYKLEIASLKIRLEKAVKLATG